MRLNTDKLKDKLTGLMRDLRRVGEIATPHSFVLCLPAGWPERPGRLRWSWRDTKGDQHSGEADSVQALPMEARNRSLVVWSPGADTLLTTASLPTRSRSKILQALPFALEDQLLGEPESMDFAYRLLGDGRLAVAVTARARMAEWMQALNAAGLHPAVLCPVTLALPITANTWSAAFEDNVLIVRTGDFGGFECLIADLGPPAMLVSALQEARAAEKVPEQLVLFNAPPSFDRQLWEEALKLPIAVSDEVLSSRIGSSAPVNLIKSGVGGGGSQLPPSVRRLRPAAIMFGIWVIAAFGFNTFEWWQLSRTAKAQREEMNVLFQRAFPDAKVVVDPALQMQRNLADLQARGGSPGDLLPLLSQIAPVLQASRGAELQGLQYAEQSATLDVRVPDFQAIEALSNAFSARGLQVNVVNSNSRGTGVESRLRVSAGRKS